MQAAILIPARLGSTRLPRKLLLNETGLPLICHTVRTAAQAAALSPGLFREVVVAADNLTVCDVVNQFCRKENLPVRAEMTRVNHSTGSDRIAEVTAKLPPEIDLLVNLQGDEPEMPPEEIVRLAGMLAQPGAEEADMATLAWPILADGDFENPNLVKVVCGFDAKALYFSRAPIPHDRDGSGGVLGYGHLGIYAYRREALARFVSFPPGKLEQREKLEQLRALEQGMKIIVGLLSSRPHKGIDTREDYDAFVSRHMR